jgi:murein L,D-transpeptidase YafK
MPKTHPPHLATLLLRGVGFSPARRLGGALRPAPRRPFAARLFPLRLFPLWLFTLAILLFVLPPSGPRAEEGLSPWKPVIQTHKATPERLIAVDKSRQRLFLYERGGASPGAREYVCTTGRAVGDKSVQGDLKTPEGVYFIVQHIGAGLDYLKYGREAYTLNYPNPVDRLRRKTGYGLWIHGRGEPLVPRQTEGCVAMINEDLAGMRSVLLPGTPVALTGALSFEPGSPGEAETVRALEKNIRDWAAAWAARSGAMFDFYDKQAYALAQGEPFSLFQSQKERLFKILPWIRTTVENIHALEGPGYWVTWFFQDYQAPNLTTKGVRRLYWIRDAKGDFKIVGMEWTPGMTTGTLLASAEPAMPPIEERPRTEEQDSAESRSQSAVPARNAAPPPKAAAPLPEAAPASEAAPRRDHVEAPSLGKMATPALAPLLLALNQGKALPVGGWTGPQALPERAMSLPAPEEAGPPLRPVPPRNMARAPANGQEAAPPAGEDQRMLASRAIFSVPATDIFYPPRSLAAAEESPATPPANAAPDPDAASEIVPLVHIDDSSAAGRKLGTGDVPAQATTTASPASGKQSKAAAPQETADDAREVASLIKAWRKAWVNANLEAYMTFYAPDAVQGSRRKAAAIRKQKAELWSKVRPAKLVMSNVQILLKDKRVLVDMRQDYADSGGNTDRGIKTLTFENINGAWLITREEWSPMPDEAGN